MVELETRPPLVRHGVFSSHGYVVPRRDGRVLAGSTMEEVGFQKEVTAGGLRAVLGIALEVVPALAAAPVRSHWSNFRPATADGLPVLGPSAVDNLFIASGHFRNGILLAPVTAEIVAACVLEGRSPVDLSPFRVDRVLL
jgi:glycine oxidase